MDAIVPTAVVRRIGVGVPGYLVDGIVAAPFGAHPAGSGACYSADFPHLRRYAAHVRAGRTRDYLDEILAPADPRQYRDLVGAADERRLELLACR